ncbi:MAG: SatD family protein [Candidatus Zixiibacteriota bacterium]
MNDRYIIVIGDIIRSRAIENRAVFQKKLAKLIGSIGNSSIITPYNIIFGDEIQAIYNGPVGLFEDIITIREGIYPERMRLIISIGEITTRLNRLNTADVDGPAFYQARNAMQDLKKSNSTIAFTSQDNFQLIDYSLKLAFHSMDKWQHNRLLILKMLMNGIDKTEIASKLGISLRSIYKNIHEGALDKIMTIFTEIENQMEIITLSENS